MFKSWLMLVNSKSSRPFKVLASGSSRFLWAEEHFSILLGIAVNSTFSCTAESQTAVAKDVLATNRLSSDQQQWMDPEWHKKGRSLCRLCRSVNLIKALLKNINYVGWNGSYAYPRHVHGCNGLRLVHSRQMLCSEMLDCNLSGVRKLVSHG